MCLEDLSIPYWEKNKERKHLVQRAVFPSEQEKDINEIVLGKSGGVPPVSTAQENHAEIVYYFLCFICKFYVLYLWVVVSFFTVVSGLGQNIFDIQNSKQDLELQWQLITLWVS